MTESPAMSAAGRQSNTVAELERRLEEAEDAYDVLLVRLTDIENAVNGGENVPMALVRRLSEGEHPVRVWREHRDMQAQDLARQAGISPALLSEIENGKKEGSIRTLAALAQALRVDLDDLVPWSQE
jgi:DNA-binding Xre family transcriptional regulator